MLAASTFLADAATELGASEVRIVPSGVEIPEMVGEPDEPPHVLFAGRLSEEKGILEFVEATEALPRVIVGDGPLRSRAPGALGFVPPSELGAYDERPAGVSGPSRREGYGMAAREAMAYGRPVVATGVGGLRDAIEDAVSGVLVPPRDPAALREALTALLGDTALRQRLGAAARRRAESLFSPASEGSGLAAVYREALSS